KLNSNPTNGSSPALPYTRNIAFTWQRITSILLIFAIALHVYYMRFLKEPHNVSLGVNEHYFVKLGVDPGLYTVAPRLNLALFDKTMIEGMEKEIERQREIPLVETKRFNAALAAKVKIEEELDFKKRLVDAMKEQSPDSSEVIALADSVGT